LIESALSESNLPWVTAIAGQMATEIPKLSGGQRFDHTGK
jgi:hypothetical protein